MLSGGLIRHSLGLVLLLTALLAAQPENAQLYTLVRVVDGDTIVVQQGEASEERVRFVGIDCFEVSRNDRLKKQAEEFGLSVSEGQLFALKAQVAVEKALADGKVMLELADPERDRYGRLRAYVWTTDGTLLNLELLRQGLALPDDYPKKAEYLGEYEEAARTARAEGNGVYQRPDPTATPSAVRDADPPRRPAPYLLVLVLVGIGILLFVLGKFRG
ncbi:MAG: thermonuclease family protein [Vulcanimicrobiota bacterium]